MLRTTFAALLITTGCVANTAEYDPDFGSDQPVADGKADAVFDVIPELLFDSPQSGEVGGDRVQFFKMTLQASDRIELEMRVDVGDLNPHMSFYYGVSSYIGSESWERDGNALRKVYVAEAAGTHIVAMRAYRGQGEGNYTVALRCLDGACAGNPAPPPDLSVAEVMGCITTARVCAFERLPRYEGRVGASRARLLFQECLAEATVDGGTCASACETTPYDDTDTATVICDSIVDSLPFYADQNEACLGELERCLTSCHGYDGIGDSVWDSSEAACWATGLNGTCDSYAREHEACGGRILAESGGECAAFCESTDGAHSDDISDICGTYADCDYFCDVDLEAAAEVCGGLETANRNCLVNQLELTNAEVCSDELDRRL